MRITNFASDPPHSRTLVGTIVLFISFFSLPLLLYHFVLSLLLILLAGARAVALFLLVCLVPMMLIVSFFQTRTSVWCCGVVLMYPCCIIVYMFVSSVYRIQFVVTAEISSKADNTGPPPHPSVSSLIPPSRSLFLSSSILLILF